METIDKIKRDEERVKKYYEDSLKLEIAGNLANWFNTDWFNRFFLFINDITDLSEEFHRKYSSFYKKTTHWYYVFFFQTQLSEQFYDDFFEKMAYVEDQLATIIRHNRVSSKWIEKNLHRIPDEVWKEVWTKVYE
jgi:hypothetical protein